jgi:hypothetical protein
MQSPAIREASGISRGLSSMHSPKNGIRSPCSERPGWQQQYISKRCAIDLLPEGTLFIRRKRANH